jgi:hypothetical protein
VLLSHGFYEGQIVRISATGQIVINDETITSIESGNSSLAVVKKGVESNYVTRLELEVSPFPWLVAGKIMSVSTNIEPCSFCFSEGLPNTVGGERLGFSNTTIQWGVDGVIKTRNLLIPPFISSGTHSLDHVDFVLVHLHEGKKKHTFTVRNVQHNCFAPCQSCFDAGIQRRKNAPQGIDAIVRRESP